MTTTPLSPAELRTPEEHRASVHRLLLHSLARAEREAAELREELIADGCTDPAVRADRSKRPASGDPEWAMGIANLLHVNDRRDSILEAFSIIRDEVRELLSAPAAPRERGKPLTVKVEGGALVIAIGVETLAFAVLAGEVFQEGVTIPDPDKFATEVVRELEQEREDGATPVHLLLDRAAYRAADNGAEGIHFPDDPLPPAPGGRSDG